MTTLNLVGHVYGRLTVVGKGGSTPTGHVRWNCVCQCGGSAFVMQRHLRTGHTVSCGCLKEEVQRTAKVTHGFSSEKKTPEQLAVYRVWAAMKKRCLNPKDPDYKHYGAKGISVYPSWMVFEAFFEDMGYPNGLTLERTNGSLGYSKDNCIWAPRKVQLDNRSATVWVKMPDGRTQTASDAYRELGCSKSMFFRKITSPDGFMGVVRVGSEV